MRRVLWDCVCDQEAAVVPFFSFPEFLKLQKHETEFWLAKPPTERLSPASENKSQDPETAPQRGFGIVTDCTKTQIDVRMGNVLECAFIVLWLQFGCKLQGKRREPQGHVYPKPGGRDRGSVSAHTGVLSKFFKTTVPKALHRFWFCFPEQGCVEKTGWSRALRPWDFGRETVSASTAVTRSACLQGSSGLGRILGKALNSSSSCIQLARKSRKKD